MDQWFSIVQSEVTGIDGAFDEVEPLLDDVLIRGCSLYLTDDNRLLDVRIAEGRTMTVAFLKKHTQAARLYQVKELSSVPGHDEGHLFKPPRIARQIIRVGEYSRMAEAAAAMLVRNVVPHDAPRWPGQAPPRITKLQRKR